MHQLIVRALGFAPRELEVTLTPGRAVRLDVELTTAQLLASVDVRADRTDTPSIVVRGYEERKRSGLAVIRDSAMIGRQPTIAAALTAIPSVRVQSRGGMSLKVMMQVPPGLSRSSRECEARLLVDGVPSDWERLEELRPADLAWIEVYPRATRLPAEFQVSTRDVACGLVAVFTKRTIAR